MAGTAPGIGVRRAAAASEGHAAEAARAALARGNAVDAVAAAVLAAAAESPGVLLGPLQILVGGAGAGLMAFDGRVRQPGRGAPRPRGSLPGEPIPGAARVGAPALPAALATALASLGTRSLLRAAAPAIERARSKSPERARLLQAIARRGAPALAADAIGGELVAAAGRAARGLLTLDDLAEVRPAMVRCGEASLDPLGVLVAPWRGHVAADASSTHVVAAADGRGMVAVACYEVPAEGVAVPALGVVAPFAAAPVLRGQPRVAPGTPRPAAAPIALRAPRGVAELAMGVAAAPDAERSLAALARALGSCATFGEAFAVVAAGRVVFVNVGFSR